MADSPLRDLVPINKYDVERAQAAVARGYPGVAPILPDLLKRIQDCNWPVATVLAPFLASIGMALVPEIRRILNTEDEVWKFWTLTCLIKTDEVAAALHAQLTRLAVLPTPAEAREEVHLVARELLDGYGLSGLH